MAIISEIKLKDFYQAVVLLTMGFPLIRLENSKYKFVTFVFDDPNYTAEEILGQYWDGRIKVNAKELINNIRELKTRLHTKLSEDTCKTN